MAENFLLSDLFREQVSKSKDPRMKKEMEADVPYSTGFPSLDFLIGKQVKYNSNKGNMSYYFTGITDGSIVYIVGRSGCGKSTLAWQIAGNIVRPFPKATIYADILEGGSTDRQRFLTKFTMEEYSRRVVARNVGITAENFYERIKILHDIKLENSDSLTYNTGYVNSHGDPIYKLIPTVAILDSLMLLMPAKYTEEEEMSGQMSATAQARNNAGLFRRITPMLKAANIILLLINHVEDDVNAGTFQAKKSQVAYLKPGEYIPGGKTPTYLANTFIRLNDNSKLKEKEGFGIDGSLVDIEIIKSRNSKSGKSITLVFNQETGFDSILSLYNLLKTTDNIKQSGAYNTLVGYDGPKFMLRDFMSKLNSDSDFRNVFMNLCTEELKKLIPSVEEENKEMEDEVVMDNSINSDIMSRFNQELKDIIS